MNTNSGDRVSYGKVENQVDTVNGNLNFGILQNNQASEGRNEQSGSRSGQSGRVAESSDLQRPRASTDPALLREMGIPLAVTLCQENDVAHGFMLDGETVYMHMNLRLKVIKDNGIWALVGVDEDTGERKMIFPIDVYTIPEVLDSDRIKFNISQGVMYDLEVDSGYLKITTRNPKDSKQRVLELGGQLLKGIRRFLIKGSYEKAAGRQLKEEQRESAPIHYDTISSSQRLEKALEDTTATAVNSEELSIKYAEVLGVMAPIKNFKTEFKDRREWFDHSKCLAVYAECKNKPNRDVKARGHPNTIMYAAQILKSNLIDEGFPIDP